jgi:hypothetical protein
MQRASGVARPEPVRANVAGARWCAQAPATALLVLVGACGGGGGRDAGVPDAASGGRFSLSWEITDGSAVLDCTRVGGSAIRVSAFPVGGGTAEIDVLPCTAGMGTTRPLEPGKYDVEIELRATQGSLAAPVRVKDAQLTRGGEINLGKHVFAVVPQGQLTFTLDSGRAGGNCGAPEQGGAGITSMVLTLRDGNGACVPATWSIGAGTAGTAGSYAADCSGSTYGCIAADQQLSLESWASGPYRLEVSASRGAETCYHADAPFTVPGNQLRADLRAITLKFVCGADAGVDGG